jgi:WXXGXW repeat (2 copies)
MKRVVTTIIAAALLATPFAVLPLPASAGVSVGISVGIAPPPLPVYVQPVGPGPGYIWTPGYWAWDPYYGYYWVPGAWVLPPEVGLLWTPGWWGWSGGSYYWHAGYWGPRVGFYGGINYGYGYFGTGYVGGHWRGRRFYYNRAVNHIDAARVHDVYVDRTVVRNVNRVSFNGGRGGIAARPTAAQRAIAGQRRWSPTPLQTRQRDTAMRSPAQRFSANHGHPAVFATPRAGSFGAPRAAGEAAARRGGATRPGYRSGNFVRAPHARSEAAPRARMQGGPANATPMRPQFSQAPGRQRGPVNEAPMRSYAAPQPGYRGVPNRPRNAPQTPSRAYGAPRQRPQERAKGDNRPRDDKHH